MIFVYENEFVAYGINRMEQTAIEKQRQYYREYRAKNREYLKAQEQLRKERDPVKYAAQKREDYDKHRTGYIKRARAHWEANKDHYNAIRRTPEYRQKKNAQRRADYVPSPRPAPMTADEKRAKASLYYFATKERQTIQKKAYYEANKAKWRLGYNKKPYWDNRYQRSLVAARLKNAVVVSRASLREFYQEVFTKPEGFCEYCGVKNTPSEMTIDHKLPYKLGGKHEVSNLALCCTSCNSTKGGMTLSDFIKYRAEIKAESTP